jgi:hypothetical protein
VRACCLILNNILTYAIFMFQSDLTFFILNCGLKHLKLKMIDYMFYTFDKFKNVNLSQAFERNGIVIVVLRVKNRVSVSLNFVKN